MASDHPVTNRLQDRLGQLRRQRCCQQRSWGRLVAGWYQNTAGGGRAEWPQLPLTRSLRSYQQQVHCSSLRGRRQPDAGVDPGPRHPVASHRTLHLGWPQAPPRPQQRRTSPSFEESVGAARSQLWCESTHSGRGQWRMASSRTGVWESALPRTFAAKLFVRDAVTFNTTLWPG